MGVTRARKELTIPFSSRRSLEWAAADGDSPVCKRDGTPADVPEYHGARETPWEAGGTILQGYIPVMTDSELVP